MKRSLTVVVLAGCVGLPIAGCSSSQPTATTVRETHALHGYPIDRTLNGLATRVDLDTVVVVEGLRTSAAVQLASSEKGFPAVVTPATGKATAVLYGRKPAGGVVRTVFGGGTTPDMAVNASKELAPDLTQVRTAQRLVIAGEYTSDPAVGEVLDPLFVYVLSADGVLTSLLESGSSDPHPTFTLTQLKAALAKR